MQTKIEKLARQISVLETSVTENKTAAEIKEKAVSETKISMLQVRGILMLPRVLTRVMQVSEDKTFLDTCLTEACESIQRCLALLSDQTEEVGPKNEQRRPLKQLDNTKS